MKKQQNKINESGLTLIELSIALIIIGLLTTAFLQLYSIQKEKRLIKLQNYKLFTIADGVARYLSENQHYPCPARRDLAVNDPDFGTSTGVGDLCNNTDIGANSCADLDGNGTDDYCVTINDGKRIRIGSVPYKDIGVGKEDVIDVYGHQFTYVVVEDQASEGLYIPDTGSPTPLNKSIILQHFIEDETTRDPVTGIAEEGENETLAVDMLFFSHGKKGAGSYTASGTEHATSCPVAAEIDSENCDNDATFVTDLYSVRSDDAAGEADDKLAHNLLNWIYIWDTAANSKSIYNRDSGNMGIGITETGTEDAAEKLHVVGNLRVDSGNNPPDPVTGAQDMGKLQAHDICDENKEDCFTSEILGGDVDSTDRLQCPSGFLMKGIRDGQAECVSILGDVSQSCPNMNYVTSFSVNEAETAVDVSCSGL